MFRITEDPLSGSLVQCLAKNYSYKNDSIVSVDMDKVGVTAAFSYPLCVGVVHCIVRHFLFSIYVNIQSVQGHAILLNFTYIHTYIYKHIHTYIHT